MDRKLKTIEILDFYDAPILIESRDQFGCLHIVYFADSLKNGKELFYSTIITEDRLNFLKKGLDDVRSVFTTSDFDLFFRIEVDGSEIELVNAEQIESYPTEHLPPSNYKL